MQKALVVTGSALKIEDALNARLQEGWRVTTLSVTDRQATDGVGDWPELLMVAVLEKPVEFSNTVSVHAPIDRDDVLRVVDEAMRRAVPLHS